MLGIVRTHGDLASFPTGTRDSFSGVKRPGREADHSPPPNAEVKNEWSYTSLPHYAFMAWCLVKSTGAGPGRGDAARRRARGPELGPVPWPPADLPLPFFMSSQISWH
jgi:hypothetical protein